MINLTIQEKFIKWLVPLCAVDKNGKLIFPFDTVKYDPELKYISEDSDYKVMIKKMSNLVKLINSDVNNGNRDIESDLWNII